MYKYKEAAPYIKLFLFNAVHFMIRINNNNRRKN